MKVINTYLEILRQPYRFNISTQSNQTTIGDVIPSVLHLIDFWQNYQNKTTQSGKKLCKDLIAEFKNRFDYELNSKLYLVLPFL